MSSMDYGFDNGIIPLEGDISSFERVIEECYDMMEF